MLRELGATRHPSREIFEVCVNRGAIGQVRLFNAHPTGRTNSEERIRSVMGEGGISECGNAQNCVEVCPKHIPLTDAIAEVGRQATLQMLRDLFG